MVYLNTNYTHMFYLCNYMYRCLSDWMSSGGLISAIDYMKWPTFRYGSFVQTYVSPVLRAPRWTIDLAGDSGSFGPDFFVEWSPLGPDPVPMFRFFSLSLSPVSHVPPGQINSPPRSPEYGWNVRLGIGTTPEGWSLRTCIWCIDLVLFICNYF